MRWNLPNLRARLTEAIASALLISVLLSPIAGDAVAKTVSEESRDHYDKAAAYVEAGEVRAAVVELKNALQQDPANVEARLLLGKVYLLLGDGAAAESALQAAERHGADADRIVAPLGRALLLQGRFAEVLNGFHPEEHEPTTAYELNLQRGEAQAALGRLSDARATYEDLRNHRADDARIPLGIARIELAEGRFEAVETHAAAALKLDPALPEATLLWADARREKGDPEGAVALYRDTLNYESMPLAMRARAHFGLTAVLIVLGRDAEAETELSAFQSSVPDSPLAAYLAALMKVRAHDFAAARSVLQGHSLVLQEYAPAQFLSGIVHYAAGDLETARSWLTRHLRSEPGNLLARKLLGATLIQLGAAANALEVLRPALAQAPDDPQTLLLLGNAHLRSGHAVEAATLLQRAAEIAPDNPRVLGQLAISQIAIGQDEEASATLSTTLDLGADANLIGYALAFSHLRQGKFQAALEVAQSLPDSAIAASAEGAAYVALGRPDEARRAFETALKIEPDFLTARASLAALRAQAGDLEGAEAHYLLLLERDKTNVLALMGLAGVEHRRGNAPASRGWLEKAVATNPTAVAPALALAESYVAAGELPAAIGLLEKLASSHRENTQVLSTLGLLQQAADRPADAVSTYKRLVEVSGGDPDAQLLLAQSQLAAGEVEAARKAYEALSVSQADNPVVWNNLAWLYHQSGDARAAEYGERAFALGPNRAEVMDTFGWILLDGGQVERAAGLLQQAYHADPDNPDITFHYAAALHRSGDHAGAKRVLQPLLESGKPFPTRSEAEALWSKIAP